MISPCVKVCRLTADTLICVGCYRYAYEIANWIHLTDGDRQAIMDQLKEREHEEEKKRESGIHSVCTK